MANVATRCLPSVRPTAGRTPTVRTSRPCAAVTDPSILAARFSSRLCSASAERVSPATQNRVQRSSASVAAVAAGAGGLLPFRQLRCGTVFLAWRCAHAMPNSSVAESIGALLRRRVLRAAHCAWMSPAVTAARGTPAVRTRAIAAHFALAFVQAVLRLASTDRCGFALELGNGVGCIAAACRCRRSLRLAALNPGSAREFAGLCSAVIAMTATGRRMALKSIQPQRLRRGAPKMTSWPVVNTMKCSVVVVTAPPFSRCTCRCTSWVLWPMTWPPPLITRWTGTRLEPPASSVAASSAQMMLWDVPLSMSAAADALPSKIRSAMSGSEPPSLAVAVAGARAATVTSGCEAVSGA